jgi:hypothetical protein
MLIDILKHASGLRHVFWGLYVVDTVPLQDPADAGILIIDLGGSRERNAVTGTARDMHWK